MPHVLGSIVMNRTLLIIPTYNEAQGIVALLKAIASEQLEDLDILIVDDNSPDGTVDCVRRYSEEDPFDTIYFLQRPQKQGLGKAYIAGFHWAIAKNYARVIQMDADFSHHPRYLKPMLAAHHQGNAIVLGSRYVDQGGVEDWGLLRRLISRFGCLYAQVILSLPIQDLTGGFKCLHIDVLKQLPLDNLYSSGYCFQIEVTYRAFLQGATIKEIPIIFTDRCLGSSKMSKKIMVEAMWNVIKLRFNAKRFISMGKL